MDLDALLSELPEPPDATLYPLPNLHHELPDTPQFLPMPTGRPTKLTEEVQHAICQALRLGNTHAASAAYAGVSETTFYNWLERGRHPETTKRGKAKASSRPFMEFLEAVTRAETEAQVRNVAVLQKAASGHDHEKTTTRTVHKVIGTKKDGAPIYATETTTTTTRWKEYDWRAALEWLKRRFPKEWGDRLKIEEEVDFELNQILDVLQSTLTPNEYEKALEALAQFGTR